MIIVLLPVLSIVNPALGFHGPVKRVGSSTVTSYSSVLPFRVNRSTTCRLSSVIILVTRRHLISTSPRDYRSGWCARHQTRTWFPRQSCSRLWQHIDRKSTRLNSSHTV